MGTQGAATAGGRVPRSQTGFHPGAAAPELVYKQRVTPPPPGSRKDSVAAAVQTSWGIRREILSRQMLETPEATGSAAPDEGGGGEQSRAA